MKKTLTALAVMSVVGAACAQSSVTLYGVVDAAWSHGSGSVSNKTALTNSGYGASQLGFRGVEDLGGGLLAGFWLEASLANDDGQGVATNSNNQPSGTGAAVNGRQGLTFNRRSTVSVGGNWGEVRLGRDYTPQYWNLAVYDPYGNLGVGTAQTLLSAPTGSTAVRASNSITYLYGHTFNAHTRMADPGFHGSLMYYTGENNSGTPTSDDGKGYGARVGWNGGPVSVALGLGKTKYAAGDIRQSNLGGSYDFGVAKLIAHYASDKNANVKGKGYLVGGLVPVGQLGMVRLAYSRYKTDVAGDPTTKKLALGYVHNLSKRSALYATWAHVTNGGGAAQALNGSVTSVNGSSSGYDIGLRHIF